MSKLFIEDTTLTAIGNAIRGKEGSEGLIPTTEMAERIANLPSGGGGINYSMEEQDTGLTWVDGKNVYQKTWVGTANAETVFASGVDTLISMNGVALDINDRWSPVPSNNSSAMQVNFQLLNTGAVMLYNTSRIKSGSENMKVTMKYTKI